MDRDSIQTLSEHDVSFNSSTPTLILTNVVCFVKYHNALLAHFSGDLLRDLWIQEIMEGVYHNVKEGQLHF